MSSNIGKEFTRHDLNIPPFTVSSPYYEGTSRFAHRWNTWLDSFMDANAEYTIPFLNGKEAGRQLRVPLFHETSLVATQAALDVHRRFFRHQVSLHQLDIEQTVGETVVTLPHYEHRVDHLEVGLESAPIFTKHAQTAVNKEHDIAAITLRLLQQGAQ